LQLIKNAPANASLELRFRDLMGVIRQINKINNGAIWSEIDISGLLSNLYHVEFYIDGERVQGNKLVIIH
ncbi:MAG: hypothetical protein ABIQ74_04630, partial [Chitinophagales bacterium]